MSVFSVAMYAFHCCSSEPRSMPIDSSKIWLMISAAEERIGRQLAEAAIERQEFVEVLVDQEVGQGPGLAVAVERGAERFGVVENLVADDEADVGMLAVALQGAIHRQALLVDRADAAPGGAVGRFEIGRQALRGPSSECERAAAKGPCCRPFDASSRG